MRGGRVGLDARDENGSSLRNYCRGLRFRQGASAVVIDAAVAGGEGRFGFCADRLVALMRHAQAAGARWRSSRGQRHRKKVSGERKQQQ